MIANPYKKPTRAIRNLLPDQSVLIEIFEYCPERGWLIWKARPLEMFKNGARSAAHNQSAWNAKMAGNIALRQVRHGYFGGTLFGEKVLAHRVIWKWMTGDDPAYIDHINGERQDNRWANLRSVDAFGNAQNQKKRSDNTSGVVGVTWNKKAEKWVAQIVADGQAKFIGQYTDFNKAVRARKIAERRHGFHENHGRTQI